MLRVQPSKHTHTQRIKKNEILPFVTTWMDLEGMMLSEISLPEKSQILYDLTYKWNLAPPPQNPGSQRYKETGGCQRRQGGVGGMGEGDQKVQTSSYKVSKYRGDKV